MRPLVLVLAGFVAYIVGYLALFPFLHAGATAMAVIPIGLVAFLLGLRWALVGGVIVQIIAVFLWQLTGVSAGDSVIRVGNGVGFVVLLGLAAGLGYMRDLNVRLTQRTAVLETLRDAARAMAAGAARDDALQIIVDAAQRVVPAEKTRLWLIREEEQELEIAASTVTNDPLRGKRLAANDGLSGRAYRTRATQILTDVRQDTHVVPQDPVIRSIIGVPVLGARRTLGVLTLVSYEIGAYNEEDARLLETLAANAAGAIETHNLVAELSAGEARLRGVLEHVPILIIASDRRGFCTYAGGNRLDALWNDPAPLVGQSLTSVFRVANPPVADAVRDGIAGVSGECTFEARGQRYRLRFEPVYAQGAVGGVTGMVAVGEPVGR